MNVNTRMHAYCIQYWLELDRPRAALSWPCSADRRAIGLTLQHSAPVAMCRHIMCQGRGPGRGLGRDRGWLGIGAWIGGWVGAWVGELGRVGIGAGSPGSVPAAVGHLC